MKQPVGRAKHPSGTLFLVSSRSSFEQRRRSGHRAVRGASGYTESYPSVRESCGRIFLKIFNRPAFLGSSSAV